MLWMKEITIDINKTKLMQKIAHFTLNFSSSFSVLQRMRAKPSLLLNFRLQSS